MITEYIDLKLLCQSIMNDTTLIFDFDEIEKRNEDMEKIREFLAKDFGASELNTKQNIDKKLH